MSATSKVLTILALWLLYTFALYLLAPDSLCLGCMTESETVTGAVAPVEAPAVVRYPIDFKWSDPTAFTNEGYEALRAELLADRTEDNILEITGLYYEGEPAPEGYPNMGFARADRVRELLGISEDRAELKARLVDGAADAREGYFEGVLFNWVDPEESVAEMVEELPDRINIRFPLNSTQEDYNPEVQQYLDDLGERLQSSGQRILLTGHTDNSGSPEYNMDLGQRRAEHIRNILIRNGVPNDIIQVESEGETQPIATNETEEGRHENRRVEVRILEQ